MRLMPVIAASLIVPLGACRQAVRPHPVEVVSISKVVDQSRLDDDVCRDWVMSKANVALYFSVAEVVDPERFHDQAIIMPCKYQGVLRMNGQRYRWEIYAGGAGYLYDGAVVNERLLCGRKCVRALPKLP